MARQLNRSISQTTLGVSSSHNARSGVRLNLVLAMGRDVELVSVRRGLETLQTAPGRVLDLQDGAVGNQDHVEETVGNNDVLRALDNARKNCHSRWERAVARGEDVLLAALLPVNAGGVNGLLDVGTVEVD